ncbi:MAG: 23S rRNA (pseudouridine(1915)-N(3))-methyltransferase RlmH [Bacilli bacterium]
MTLKFLLPGKAREKFIKDGYQEYLKRLSRFAKLSLINLNEEPLSSSPNEKEISLALKKEAVRAMNQIKEDDILFLVDIHGPLLSSQELAEKISQASRKNGNLVFLLGSSYGLDDSLRKRANYSFSLSNMTFTHYMAMLLTLEQVYRAMKINSGEAYDK